MRLSDERLEKLRALMPGSGDWDPEDVFNVVTCGDIKALIDEVQATRAGTNAHELWKHEAAAPPQPIEITRERFKDALRSLWEKES